MADRGSEQGSERGSERGAARLERGERRAARLERDICALRARSDALRRVSASIRADCFTDDERDAIDRQLRECEAELTEKELARTQHSEFVATTLDRCQKDLLLREETLNGLFSEEGVRGHEDVMGVFAARHAALAAMLRHDDGSDSDDDGRRDAR